MTRKIRSISGIVLLISIIGLNLRLETLLRMLLDMIGML